MLNHDIGKYSGLYTTDPKRIQDGRMQAQGTLQIEGLGFYVFSVWGLETESRENEGFGFVRFETSHIAFV